MSEGDLVRYIEREIPGIGHLQNDICMVVCEADDCNGEIRVDPETRVAEDDDAVEMQAGVRDMETGEDTGRTDVELYCSSECRMSVIDGVSADD